MKRNRQDLEDNSYNHKPEHRFVKSTNSDQSSTKSDTSNEGEKSELTKLLEEMRKKPKRSRWETVDKTDDVLKGLVTTMPKGLTKVQEDLFLWQLQLEEASRRLRSGNYGLSADSSSRSPSPPPTYDGKGQRTNTREMRARQKLEEQRQALVLKISKANPDYIPPSDFKGKFSDKVFIPDEEHPQIQFNGLLLGPRGVDNIKLQNETSTIIQIRGKGSLRGSKFDKHGRLPPGHDEPTHAFVTGTNMDNVQKACARIREVIEEAIRNPNENQRRQSQLRELAIYNGTFKGDSLTKFHEALEVQSIFTNQLICEHCNGVGHVSKDCKVGKVDESSSSQSTMDQEFLSLMAELDGKPKSVTPDEVTSTSNSTNNPPAIAASTAIPTTSNSSLPAVNHSNMPTNSSAPMPGWQYPTWNSGYMMPNPMPWAPVPPNSYGANIYMPPYNPMYSQPWTNPMGQQAYPTNPMGQQAYPMNPNMVPPPQSYYTQLPQPPSSDRNTPPPPPPPPSDD